MEQGSRIRLPILIKDQIADLFMKPSTENEFNKRQLMGASSDPFYMNLKGNVGKIEHSLGVGTKWESDSRLKQLVPHIILDGAKTIQRQVKLDQSKKKC